MRWLAVAAALVGATAPADELDGMVLCGYQGWFRAEGDGSGLGWRHYQGRRGFEPGNAGIEMWPDVTELPSDDRFATAFRHADGSQAEVFSSDRATTVGTHFRWMKEYGIDGVFLQRFATSTRDPKLRASLDRVLANVREGAAAQGRRWALMYDLSGLGPREVAVVSEDWERLKSERRLGRSDASYLRFRDRPLVALWGIGFNDRETDFDGWRELVRAMRADGCSVMLGVPYYWRTLDRDCVSDPRLHAVIRSADLVSPWSVGRFGTPEDARRNGSQVVAADRRWCEEHGLGYLPVVFPGFSWHNLMASRGKASPFDAIPRRKGEFLWSQGVAARRAGCRAVYVAMFDEIDEGTAIFKTRQDPPVGDSPFLREEGVAGDHYLRVSGELGRMLRGERGVEWRERAE